MFGVDLQALAGRLLRRNDPSRSEASLQSDVRTLLLSGNLNLIADNLLVPELETPVGAGRRIDIEIGFTVIETKRDLRKRGVRGDAEPQLAGYLRQREESTGQRYVGVLTDGAEWVLFYRRPDGEMQEVSTFRLIGPNPDLDALLVWLEGVLATAEAIVPSPAEIARRLGAGSPTHELERAQLAQLWSSVQGQPAVRVKRELWARLLTAALGTKFTDDDELFIEHTYLVVTAEVIAHAVVGFNVGDPKLTPSALLTGQLFADAQVGGVVEDDFFDWVLEAQEGPAFVRGLARRLGRFAWATVEHDVLKELYESVISAETRKSLGEYYTPDWLAERMVAEVVDDPLNQRVLDPACGSGTFLFHAVRHYIVAAEAAGRSAGEAAMAAATQVAGLDLHPVAVTLARVTFLLGIGAERLTHPDRAYFSVPVFLGDSLLWRYENTLLDRGGITIPTSDHAELFARELHFPARVLADAGRFDQLVIALADRAVARPDTRVPDITPLLNQFAVHPDDREGIAATFSALCALHDEGRDHIWSYYSRNLARPYWLTMNGNHVDRLVGNPPWVAYRFMPQRMQQDFKARSQQRGLWTGRQVATQQDLSGYFVARCVELYLRPGGRFAFVMPLSVLRGTQWQGFREAEYPTPSGTVRVSFTSPWDLENVKPTPFPVPSAVLFGEHSPQTAAPLPRHKAFWSGRLPSKNVSWSVAAHLLSCVEQTAEPEVELSPYAQRSNNGATIYPRVLTAVEDAPAGPLGAGAGRRSVRSRRSRQEQPPWSEVPSLGANVETGFIKRLYLGSSLLPFRVFPPIDALIPYVDGKLLSGTSPERERYPGLAAWWRDAERLWDAHKGTTTMSLTEQLNYQNKLLKQFPVAPHRVVFPKSGMTLAAARLSDPYGIVENTAYWAACASADEAHYLTAVINSDPLLSRVKNLQSRGQFGRRDFNKVIFRVALPLFDPNDEVHQALVAAGARAEQIAAAVVLPIVGFQQARVLIRAVLATDGVAAEINEAAEQLLAQA